MSNRVEYDFRPMDMVWNEVKGFGKILITINEDAKAFVSWDSGARSWVGMADIARETGDRLLAELDKDLHSVLDRLAKTGP